MRSFKLKFLLPFFLLAGFQFSCSTPKPLEYRDFKNFTVEKLGFASTFVKMDLLYYNPNNFGLQLKRTDLDIFIENKYLGHTSQEYLVTIPRREEFAIPITLEVDMKNLLQNTVATLLNKEILVKITGTVKVGKLNVFKSFPVNYEGNQKLTLF